MQESVSAAGIPDKPLASWDMALAPDGVRINASWEYPDPARYSLVWLSQGGLDRNRSYRIRIQAEVPNGEAWLLLESPPARPDDEDRIHVLTRWAPLTAMLTGADNPRILIIRDDGETIRDDAVDPAIFASALAAPAPLLAEIDAMVAHYRDRCTYFDGGPILTP